MALDHAMIDLETLGTRASSIILTIGAVRFDPNSLEGIKDVWPKLAVPWFYREVSLQSCIDLGMTFDADTLKWWMRQSEGARNSAFNPDAPVHIGQALNDLNVFLNPPSAQPVEYVWSHGATFDLPILADAYPRCGRVIPWKYPNCRDTRTLFDMAFGGKAPMPAGYEHNAMWDAARQAVGVQESYAKLRAIATMSLPGSNL